LGRFQVVVATQGLIGDGQECSEAFGGGVPAEGFAWSAVEFGGDGGEVFAGVAGEVGAFGEVLAEQAVGVFVGSALPGRVWVAEVDGHAGGGGELVV
jgi:hypothetical protein